MGVQPSEDQPDAGQIESSDPLHFPAGLPGFEDHKQFLLIKRPDLRPFQWLQSRDDPQIAFPVISCLLLNRQVFRDISDDHLSLLGHPPLEELAPYYILRVDPEKKTITANTKAPVLISSRTMIGNQVILEGKDLRVDEPLMNLVPPMGGA